MKPVSTSRLQSKSGLSDSHAYAVLSALPHAVFVFRADDLTQCVFENDAACAWRASSDLFTADTQIGMALRQVADTGTTMTLHECMIAGDQPHTVTVSGYADLLLVTVAPPVRVYEHGQDARDALRPAALMARTLAHEIKNPLAGIRGAAQLLAKQAPDAAAAELPDLIVRETTRIARLVDDVMMFDAEDSVQKVPLNLHAPIEQALSSLAMVSDIAVARHFDPSLPDIAGDHDRLVQVFMNLCKNAVEAGANAVTVRSFYALADTAPVDRRTHARLPIAVRIEDNGQGMDDETRSRLFEAYYTTKADGQGLGLPIVAKIVHDLGGQISVESTAGRTRFTLYFPHHHTLPEVL